MVLGELNLSQRIEEIPQNPKESKALYRIIKMVQGELFRADHVLAKEEMVFVWVPLAQSDVLTILVKSD